MRWQLAAWSMSETETEMSTQMVINPLSQRLKGRAHMPGLAVPSDKRTGPQKKVCG